MEESALSAAAKPQQKRVKRIVLVNRDFQLRYTRSAVLVGLLSTLLSAFLILYPLYRFEILRIPRFLPWPVMALMGAAAIINIGIVAIMGIFLTHRVAGPVFSLIRQFRKVEQGSFQAELRLREGDDLKYVARNFNEMVVALRKATETDLNLIAASRQGSSQDALDKLEERLKQRLSGKGNL